MSSRQQAAGRSISVWEIVAAILLPPLGVFMARGLTPAFWLTVVATLIGWVPGIILALLLLFVPEHMPIR